MRRADRKAPKGGTRRGYAPPEPVPSRVQRFPSGYDTVPRAGVSCRYVLGDERYDSPGDDVVTAAKAFFSPALFVFLSDVAANNNREWFHANRTRYERDVRDPVLAFITAVTPKLRSVSPHIVADPSKVGGSMFRINRDTRFSRDRDPYSTAVKVAFRHDAVDRHMPGPGCFMQIGSESVMAAGGLYAADAAMLDSVRRAIAANGAKWRRIIGNSQLAPMIEDRGPALKNPPRGFPADHPLIDDLKRKTFVWYRLFSMDDACSPDFMDRYVAACKSASPFTGFLASALGMEW